MRSESLLLAGLLSASPAAPPLPSGTDALPVVAVLSSDAKPYWEAFEGFQKEFGAPVTVLQLRGETPPEVPEGALVVAFGGRAALRSYPPGVRMIYCLSPGKTVPSERYVQHPIKVHMRPEAAASVPRLLELQPGLRRLAVLWAVEAQEHEALDLRRAATGRFEVLSVRAASAQELLERLRELRGRADALWLTPDPAIVDADNFNALREYSRANRVPFYCPTEGLVERGCTASVSGTYAEMGGGAAQAARAVLAGRSPDWELFPARVHVTLSHSAAQNAGLSISPEVLRRADRLLP